MQFKPNVFVPPGVEIERYFSTVEIDNGDATITFFENSPTLTGEVDENYDTNPLSDTLYHVVLAVSIDPLARVIQTATNIDPLYVVNNLFDSTFKITSNKGRQQEVHHPLKDYMNANIRAGLGIASDAAASFQTEVIVSLGSTGKRYLDNIFFIKPYEPFRALVEFNSATWPATADWTTAARGRFGLRAAIWFAKMTASQLNAYNRRLVAAAGYSEFSDVENIV